MKGWKVFWGLALIAVAVLLILDALGVLAPITSIVGEVTFWQIFGGVALLCGIVANIASGDIWVGFVLLGFIFMIFERNIAHVLGLPGEDIINNWLVFGCSALLCAGFSCIFPKRKKKKKVKTDKDGVHVHINLNEMGASEVYVDCLEFGNTYDEHKVRNKIGAVEVHFENAESYRGGGTLNVESSIGGVEIHVPRNWRVNHSDLEVNLGAFEMDENESAEENAPVLNIVGSVRIGAVEIERV